MNDPRYAKLAKLIWSQKAVNKVMVFTLPIPGYVFRVGAGQHR